MTVSPRYLRRRNLRRIRRSDGFLAFLTRQATRLGLTSGAVFDALSAGRTAGQIRTARPYATATSGRGIANNGPSSGTRTAAIFRTAQVVRFNLTRVRLVFTNGRLSTTGEVLNPHAVTYQACIERADGGAPTRVTFGGQNSVTLASGQSVVSDEITLPVAYAAGTRMFVRTQVSVANLGEVWPTFLAMSTADGEGFNDTLTWLMSPNASIPTLSAAGHVGPSAVLGQNIDARSVGIIGSSSANGQGDTAALPELELGYFAMFCSANRLGYTKLAVGQDTVQRFVSDGVNSLRMQHLRNISADAVIFQLGGNDLTGGRTLVQIQNDLRTAWDRLRAERIAVWQSTYTPTTNSTDSWATLVNQTPFGQTPLRLQLNDWLREQAAQGAFDLLLDVAPFVADPTDPTRFRVDGTPNRFTVDGTHLSPHGHAQIVSGIGQLRL